LKRIAIATLASLASCWAIWEAARTGIARSLAERAELSGELDSAHRAIKLAPNDAEAHFARGQVLQNREDYAAASVEFERAVQLRPRDYFLWLMLGVTRDENQDQEGAWRALRQAAKLAPSYAPPRWQLGNLLLRMGQYDEAFTELQLAASANPKLWPNVIDLAWGIYGGDVDAVVTVIHPHNDEARLSLALFFARLNQPAAALDQFRQTAIAPNAKNEILLDEMLKARAFSAAYEVWETIHGLPLGALPDGRASDTAFAIPDGGFEEPVTVGQAGFGWQITPNVANVTMSVDTNEHQSGSRSLRLDFRGNSSPKSPLLTQLALVEPQTHYHLSFAALAKDLVSAAAPTVTITDASDPKNTVLVESPPLRSDAPGWRDFTIDFNTSTQTQAIVITVARQSCTSDPCPAFGTLWLDSFSLKLPEQ
jgi:Tfp pilus assembly protein PilF